jgi:UDP-N-acetylmuramate--alanine ligase
MQIIKRSIKKGAYIFDVQTPKEIVKNITLRLPGKHNVMNTLAALALANEYGVSLSEIKQRIETFKGVQRRFTYRINTGELVLIDDYAHHPTEIHAVANSVREMYPAEKVLAVFQPHLFSRTRDFVDDFAKELATFDELLLLDIYPARELPIEGVNSEWLLNKIELEKKKLVSKENLIKDIKNSDAKVIVMLGAGDIGMMISDVVNELKIDKKYK